jgi:superfamily II DNA/RNA helicase
MQKNVLIQKALENLKIATLNEMQLASIEACKKQRDVVLLSPTGSGKTLGFLLPVLNLLAEGNPGIQALILVPSRELAIQIEQVFRQMGTGFKVNCCYGGHDTKVEKNNLDQAPALLVGTPGRIAYHIRKKNIDTNSIRTLVLDEFDKALEFGFQNDMSMIIDQLKRLNLRILTSATKSLEIPDFTGVEDPVKINYLTDVQLPGLKVKAVLSEAKDKLDTLLNLICKIGNKPTLIFCNHREAVERISELLFEKGLQHAIFHGKLEQEDRERALIKFRNGSQHILIATDLASRGLDIPEIEYVIHYQLPVNEEAFIHRNGRTARMHAEGTSYLLLMDGEKAPAYLKESPMFEKLPVKATLPRPADWATLYIAAGKKDKVNKMDIVGLLHQKGNLQKEELGLIEVLDFSSYAAVKRSKIEQVMQLVKNEKIKNKKVKIEVAR